MSRLKSKSEIPNYDEKAKILRECGWVRTEWRDQGKKIDMMGRETEEVYNTIMKWVGNQQ